MRIARTRPAARARLGAFTLAEILVATAIGSILAGTVLLLLCQTATEQQYGFADLTVEEKAYTLEANLTSCLRGVSASMGMTPNWSSAVNDSNGNLLGYQSIFVFTPGTNGAYTMGSIAYTPSTGAVTYTSNLSNPSTQLWMTNTSTAALTQFYFSSSFNLDGSQNNSLVNVCFQMSDDGFSQQGATNNPTSIHRSFSVQMRNDN